MALDEPRDTDDVFDVKGLKFVVDKEFMGKAEKINIDFTGMGFHLDSNFVMEQSGCSSCGSDSSGCETA